MYFVCDACTAKSRTEETRHACRFVCSWPPNESPQLDIYPAGIERYLEQRCIEIMQQQNFYEEGIPAAVSHLQPGHQVPTVNGHFDAGQCRVFKVDFADGESWAVRVPLFLRHASREFIIYLVEHEADVLEELGKKEFRWVAKLRGHSATFDNAVGHPFIAYSWIPGRQLSWSDGFPPRPIRDKVLGQVAVIHASLVECTKESSMSDVLPINQRRARSSYRGHCHRGFHEDNKQQDPSSSQWTPSTDHRTRLS